MADMMYKCVECGWILELEEDGKKPETCPKCGANATIVAVAQESGKIGCVGK
ncbi:hypothetical protein [Sporomusa sp. KB1]|uniref:hypothetical protein n=1 Tax=Sporomusa sp. KB1 TaxID=943346 RepID=UPI0011ACB110|nr:hypothetical protein [Sporomusa sp. KB1]TWH51979.1 hypothetical protein Salpa_0478 [Sporomusa sp. KB1]